MKYLAWGKASIDPNRELAYRYASYVPHRRDGVGRTGP